MCNVDCIRWGAKNLTKEEIKGKTVIEVGSYDVNGSLRYIVELLEPAEYMGTDVMKGPGVDIICPAENLVERFGKYKNWHSRNHYRQGSTKGINAPEAPIPGVNGWPRRK